MKVAILLVTQCKHIFHQQFCCRQIRSGSHAMTHIQRTGPCTPSSSSYDYRCLGLRRCMLFWKALVTTTITCRSNSLCLINIWSPEMCQLFTKGIRYRLLKNINFDVCIPNAHDDLPVFLKYPFHARFPI